MYKYIQQNGISVAKDRETLTIVLILMSGFYFKRSHTLLTDVNRYSSCITYYIEINYTYFFRILDSRSRNVNTLIIIVVVVFFLNIYMYKGKSVCQALGPELSSKSSGSLCGDKQIQ